MDNIQEKRFLDVIEEMKTRNAVDPVPGDSAGYVTVSVEKNAAEALLGHPFDSNSDQDAQRVSDGIDSGELIFALGYAESTSRFNTPFDGMGDDKIVISRSKSSNAVSVVENGNVKRITQENNDGSGKDSTFNNSNTRIWDERDIATDPTNHVADVGLKLDGETQTRSAANPVDYSAIGQIFGSAIGRAIVGKDGNPFVSLTAQTVAGYVGQKFVQALINGPGAIDLAQVDLADVFDGQGVSLAGAGLGAASSFLTAELATSIGLNGVGAQMFNAAVGGYLGSVLNQVRQQGFNVLTAVVDWNVALHASEVNIASAFGSFLAHQFVHPESQFGAVGGQLAGAVGSALAYSFSVTLGEVLNVFLPGVGAFFGTIIGTMLGDAIAGDPGYPKAFHDIEIIGSDPTHFQNRLVGTDDHGNASVSQEMGDQVPKIANSYLDAVQGAAIYYSGKVMIGYNAGAAPYQYITGWFPDGINGPSAHFASATDAIQEGVRELLRNTEVIGGDLLIKRAHQAFMNGPHAAPTEIAPDFTDLATLGGDLRTAQDYEQYLNDRETINALIELYPNSAFTAGWAATFARVHELGLDHVRGSDFTGGLVGYLDSVNKAGLGAEAANATVSRGAGNSVVVEVKVANGTDIPGSLSVFADQMKVTSNASGQTLQFTVDSGVVANGFHFPGPTASGGDGANDLWIGSANAEHTYTGTGGHDILTGGTMNDVIHGGAGWDFIDGGYGNDYLFGEDGGDILRGGANTDFLFGGLGDDTYVFNRGDGVDTVVDHYSYMEDPAAGTGAPGAGGGTPREVHPDAGSDSLVFGPGIVISDVAVRASADGRDLIVGVKDPAHPNVAFEQLTDKITLTNWIVEPKDRIEFLRFADGNVLNVGAAVGTYLVPFGETLSHNSVAENSAIGTVVGTVSTFDLEASANLTYSLDNDVGGRFAINASTGVVTTTAVPLDYEANALHSWQIAVRVSDGTHVAGQAFTINVTDVEEAPVNATLAGGSVPENSPGGTLVGTVTGTDPDAGASLHYSLTDNAGGRFLIHPIGEIVVVDSQLIDYEAAHSWSVTVRTTDQYGLSFDKAFSIAVTDVYEGPTGFGPVTAPLANYGIGAGGWSDQNHFPRQLADVNGDGMADIVGFALDGVVVSLATGNGQFASPVLGIQNCTVNSGWSSQDLYPRQLADVNGDGMADLVAFGADAVIVSLATGGGHFGSPVLGIANYAVNSGWNSMDHYPRLLADVNGDHMADIVAFGADAVVVSLATGGGHFGSPVLGIANYTPNSGGWNSQDQFPRELADVNGDGMADIVAFGGGGAQVSLATGGGHFASPVSGIDNFGYLAGAGGWTSQDQFPRQLADVNGDHMADIVGFGGDLAAVSLATGNGHFAAPVAGIQNFTFNSSWVSQNLYPRELGDVNGDGTADLIGFGHDGVLEALSHGFHLV
jgi:hypothetical protein